VRDRAREREREMEGGRDKQTNRKRDKETDKQKERGATVLKCCLTRINVCFTEDFYLGCSVLFHGYGGMNSS